MKLIVQQIIRQRRILLTGITPNVIRLGWVSLFADIASEMLYPIIPIFMTTVIGAPVSALGFIEGLAEATASFFKFFSGKLSDATGKRKPWIVAGYTLSAFAKPLIGLSTAWSFVLLARVLDRFGKGLRSSPRDALLANSVPHPYQGKAFGWHRGMDTLGAIIGPLLSLGLISFTPIHQHLRWFFVLAFIPAIFSVFCIYYVQETEKSKSIKVLHSNARKKLLNLSSFPISFKLYLVSWGLFSITNSSDMFIILRAKEIGFSTLATILLYCFYNLTYALASPWLGHLSDQLGRKKILIFGLSIFALVYFGFSLTSKPWVYWILFGVYGFYNAATDGVGKVYAIDLVPKDIRGEAIGIFGAVSGISALFASTIAGLLWTNYGSWAVFGFGSAGAIFAMLFIAFISKTGPLKC